MELLNGDFKINKTYLAQNINGENVLFKMTKKSATKIINQGTKILSYLGNVNILDKNIRGSSNSLVKTEKNTLDEFITDINLNSCNYIFEINIVDKKASKKKLISV